MPRVKSRNKVFNLELTKEEHATLKRRAAALDMSMHAYAVEMLTTGRINNKKK